jgi:autotransporter-associated beta strand protein
LHDEEASGLAPIATNKLCVASKHLAKTPAFTTGTISGAIAIESSESLTIDQTTVSSGVNLSNAITGSGVLTVKASAAGQLKLSGSSTFSGGTTLDSGTLELGVAQAAGTGAITFATGANATLQIDGTSLPTNAIDMFAYRDSIDLSGIKYTGGAPTLNGSTLTVTEGGQQYSLTVRGHRRQGNQRKSGFERQRHAAHGRLLLPRHFDRDRAWRRRRRKARHRRPSRHAFRRRAADQVDRHALL